MLLNLVISMKIGLCYICVDGHWCAVSYGFISMGTTNNFDGSLLRAIEYFAIKREKKKKLSWNNLDKWLIQEHISLVKILGAHGWFVLNILYIVTKNQYLYGDIEWHFNFQKLILETSVILVSLIYYIDFRYYYRYFYILSSF